MSARHTRHQEAALERRGAGDGWVFMSGRRGSDPAITRIIDRLRELVAEQRRLEGRGSGEQLDARGREIVRLQRQLATVVRRELTA